MRPDLESIYSELDLSPSCSLEEFQRAYRMQIAELHPDRNSGPQSDETRAALRDLIWVYAAVNRFPRRYGRMPGGHSSNPLGDIPNRTRGQASIAFDRDSSDGRRPEQPTWVWVVLFITTVLILLTLELADSG